MWLLTNFGMFSAVERRPGSVPAGDNRTLQIRARSKDHLDTLRDRYMGDTLGPTVTADDDPRFKGSDYEFRAYCTPEAFGRAAMQTAMDIDYTNFKNSVKDHELHEAYMDVWTALYTGLSNRHKTFKRYGSIFETSRQKAKGHNRQAGTTRWTGTGYTEGYYESAFGAVEDDDDTPMYRMSTTKAIEAKVLPYGHMDVDGDFAVEDDLFPEHSQESIDAMLDKYAPFVAPEVLPNRLGRAEAVEWLGTTGSMFKKFLAGNRKWRTYKTGSQNQYQFPKSVMGEMQEHFDIWMSERIADQKD